MKNLELVLTKLIAKQLGIDEAIISLESNFKELGADSLDVVEVALAIEDEFNLEINEDDADGIETVGDMLRVLEKLTNK